MSAFELKPWNKVVVPHEDILKGDFEMARYAAHLGQVDRADPNCPTVYRDPVAFYKATYRTEALNELLLDVSRVLAGGHGNRVLQLRTPFGGGKTHTLIALLHLTRSREALNRAGLLEMAPEGAVTRLPVLPDDPGPTRVAVLPLLDFDAVAGRHEAGLHIRSVWGELAYRIGGAEAYAAIRETDQLRVAPGGETLRRLLEAHPTLILMDEVLGYVEAAFGVPMGDTNFGRQTLQFLFNLTEVVRDLPHGALVYSLQKSVGQAFGDENLLSQLDDLVSRIDAKKEPVSGDDVLRVVQRRLFQDLGPIAVRHAVGAAYAAQHVRYLGQSDLSESERRRAADEAAALQSRIADAYPFHPALLDLMYHRWGTLPTYQRTRGALQFLATAVGALWRRGESIGPLIGPGDVLLDDPMVRSAFFTQVGEKENLKSALDSDLLGSTARCQRVDDAVAADNPRLAAMKPGTRLSRAIVLYSHGAKSGEERGVLRDDLILAVQAPDLEGEVLNVALEGLVENLLYIHTSGRRYRFEKKPNLNKLLDDEAKKLDKEDVDKAVSTEFEKTSEAKDGYVIWPPSSDAIADRRPRFTVAFLGPDHVLLTPDAQNTLARQWAENCGGAKRAYKNAVAFAFPDAGALDRARLTSRRATAADNLIRDRKRHSLDADDVADLQQRKSKATSEMTAALRQLYPVLYLPVAAEADAQDPIKITRFDIAQHNALGPNVLGTIYAALSTWVFETAVPRKIATCAHLGEGELGGTGHWIAGPKLVDEFFGSVQYPKLLTLGGLKKSIAHGVTHGVFGYVMGGAVVDGRLVVSDPDTLTFKSPVTADDIDLTTGSALVSAAFAEDVRAKAAEAAAKKKPPVVVPVDDDDADDGPVNVGPVTTTTVGPPVVTTTTTTKTLVGPTPKAPLREVRLEFRANAQQLFSAFQALSFLSEWADENFAAHVHIYAKGSKDLSKNTYETSVVMALEEEGVEVQKS